MLNMLGSRCLDFPIHDSQLALAKSESAFGAVFVAVSGAAFGAAFGSLISFDLKRSRSLS